MTCTGMEFRRGVARHEMRIVQDGFFPADDWGRMTENKT